MLSNYSSALGTRPIEFVTKQRMKRGFTSFKGSEQFAQSSETQTGLIVNYQYLVSNLVNTFSTFFVSKITSLKSAISDRLASIPNVLSFQDPLHTGPFLHTCKPVTSVSAEVLRILQSVPPKSSSVDFVPPSLVKSCAAVFAELIAELANRSFRDGSFPSCFKHAAITPFLKGPLSIHRIPPVTGLSLTSISYKK